MRRREGWDCSSLQVNDTPWGAKDATTRILRSAFIPGERGLSLSHYAD